VLSQRWPSDAPYIWVPWKFLGLPDYTHGYFSQNFSWTFIPIDPTNVRTKFEVRSFTRFLIGVAKKFLAHTPYSPQNPTGLLSVHSFPCNFRLKFWEGLQTSNVGKGRLERREWYCSKERWRVPRPSIHSNFSSIFTRLEILQLVSKISDLCDHNPPTSQTDRRTGDQRPCFALYSASRANNFPPYVSWRCKVVLCWLPFQKTPDFFQASTAVSNHHIPPLMSVLLYTVHLQLLYASPTRGHKQSVASISLWTVLLSVCQSSLVPDTVIFRGGCCAA